MWLILNNGYVLIQCWNLILIKQSEGYTVEQSGRGFQLQKGNESKLLISEGFMGMYEIFSE